MTFDPIAPLSAKYSGVVRVFPLPDLVLFPRILQPLHIFEPRYRQLFEDAISSDGLIAVATLAPGWEDDYEGRPPVYAMACLARIVSYCRLESGSYNALVGGLSRVRLLRELSPTKPFREAVVRSCGDRYPRSAGPARSRLRGLLRSELRDARIGMPEAYDQLADLFRSRVPLGVVTDAISYTLDIPTTEKRRLFEELNVYRRARRLLKCLTGLRTGEAADPGFPPAFSVN